MHSCEVEPLFLAAAAIACAVVAASQTETLGDVRSVFDGRLPPDIRVQAFRHIDRLFPTRTVRRGAEVLSLPPMSSAAGGTSTKTGPLSGLEFISLYRKRDLIDSLSLNRIGGLLILKDGKTVLEDYELGNTPTDIPSPNICPNWPEAPTMAPVFAIFSRCPPA